MGKITIFTRLADIKALGYVGPPDIDRRSLPYHDLQPKVSTSNFTGKEKSFVSWNLGNGVTASQSPASAWAISETRGVKLSDILRRFYEALELPGSAADYHDIIWRTAEALWDWRRDEPEVLVELERLWLLDLKLVETLHDMALNLEEELPYVTYVRATIHLIQLYEREGYISEALEVARRGAALGQVSGEVDRLEMLLKDLAAEDDD